MYWLHIFCIVLTLVHNMLHHNDTTTYTKNTIIYIIYNVQCSLKFDLRTWDYEGHTALRLNSCAATDVAKVSWPQRGNLIQRLINKGITTIYKPHTFGSLSEAFERLPDRILRSQSDEIGIPHRSSVHSFKSLTLANLLSQETVYRSAAVHRRQPSYKKLRASFEVSCSWN